MVLITVFCNKINMKLVVFLLLVAFPSVTSLHSGTCLGLVCGRNGDCHTGPVINNNQSTYWCRCHPGYGGDVCQQKCELRCDENDKCVFDGEQKQVCVCKDCDIHGNHLPARINCPSGYGGEKCDTKGWCYPNICMNGGKCAGAESGAKCICPNGFKGERCELDVNECEDRNACGSRSTCINTNGTYLCVCPQGFLPPDCILPGNQTSVEFKPKVCYLEVNARHPYGKSMYCQNGGVCEDSKCHCPPGYSGDTCESESNQKQCGIECIHGDCFSITGGFHCICHDGYSGSSCEHGQDNCLNNKCAPGSKCINGENGYFCDCPERRTGQYCEKVDCTAIPGICNHGRCINSPLSDKPFQCACDPGYEGELCDTDKNECLADHMCLNNGTCVNLPGSFRCDCPRGFGGKYCDELINLCQNEKCLNDGVCMHTSDRSPVCQCKNGYIGKKCEKACPSGFGGVRCELPLTKGICSRLGAKCFNGGKCIGGFCTCPPDFTGDQCESSRKSAARMASDNTCESDPCMNNATCIDVDAHIGYVCICQPGFDGDICERRKDLCSENPCANGGECKQINDSFTCTCPYGFNGSVCENEENVLCKSGKCKNGGVCRSDGKTVRCECAYGFAGHECEEKINMETFFDKEKLLCSVCEKNRCWERANDGNCDADCNFAACKFDGGDCSGRREPFSRCNYGNLCADLFANGVCNQACNNEDCLYDGMDCMSSVVRCPAKIREYCAARFANGICDSECDTDGCGFDGGDCDHRKNATIINDIRIKLQMDPKEFQLNGGQTLMEISSVLRAAVRIRRDEEGPLVFEWDGEKESDRIKMDVQKLSEQRVLSPIRKVRSAMSIGGKGVVVYLEVREDCPIGKCLYSSAQSIVDVISARLAKKGTGSFGAPISEAIVATPRKNGGSFGTGEILVSCLGFLCVMVIASAGILTVQGNRSRKRRIINAPVWVPPMENDERNKRHHSLNSSQHSLLDSNGYYAPKRHRNEYDSNGAYNQYYPTTYGNSYEYQVNQEDNPAIEKNNVLHAQAASSEPILEEITRENVNLVDSRYHRTVLHWICANSTGKKEEVIVSEAKRCIYEGADVNSMDCDENTPLMLAVKSRRTRLAVVLMKAGADPTIYNKSERSTLHESAVNKDKRMMEILLTDQRIVKEFEELDRNGLTVLMTVAQSEGDYQVEMAKMLMAKGAKIDSDGASRKDSEIYKGRTALHYAALAGNLPMVQFLVSNNANKDKQDEAGQTPIMLAAKEGHEDTVLMLVRSGASVEVVDALDRSARQLAKAKCFHNIVAIFDSHAQVDYTMEMAMRQQQQQQSMSRKMPKLASKTVKKPSTKKKDNSRDSTHLTPPPSDGSTSSPSPQHFLTTSHTTPPRVHYLSPEYQTEVGDGFQPQCSLPNADMWYTASPTTFPPLHNEQMMRQAAYNQYY